MTPLRVALLFVLGLPLWSLGSDQPRLSRKVTVPPRLNGAEISPNGETNAMRYTAAFEAYWWNCVEVKAAILDATCPFACSGNAAAAAGCADGAMGVSSDIDRLLDRFPREQVQQYLRKLAHDPAATAKTKRLFPDGPRAEKAPE